MLALLLTANIAFNAPALAATISDELVRAAIVASLRARLGPDIEVVVDDLHVQITSGHSLIEASPEPGTRLDGPMHFILRWADTDRSGARIVRAGTAEARVHVTVSHAHTTTMISRGSEIGPSDVVEARHQLAAGPLRAWPTVSDVVSAKALRDLAPDACLAPNMVTDRPTVKSGDDVTAITRVAGVEISARMVAVESGHPGKVIRVVNRQSKRALRARILAQGRVEILQ